ncbi:hypothetical protein [Modestobacter sp. SYSU DS0290]
MDGTPARRAPDLLEVLVHLSVPTPHLPAVHLPALRVPARLTAASVLLTVVYLAALAVAATAPAEQALAGALVLAGLVSRWAVRRRRSATAAVPVATDAVDTLLPAPALAEEPARATA